MRRSVPIAIATLLLSASGAAAQPAPLTAATCPQAIPADITCLRGRDANGAFVTLARPANWSGVLLVHIHGGPRLGPVSATTSDEDVLRFSEFPRAGHAVVFSSRRRGGFGAVQGAADADLSRLMAIETLGRPRLTIVHGQSWGANVAAKLIETLNAPGADGRRPYDGALLTAGVLANATRAYDPRMDLRAAFQLLCGTHPRPDEAQYHLGLGLPAEATMTRADLDARFNACTGANRPAAERTEAQRRILADLAAASRLPEASLLAHMVPATWTHQDIARHVTQGRSPFGNMTARYSGTSDDAAFNARVPRFAADPEAVRLLAADADLTGRIDLPVVSMHAIRDATVPVESQAVYRETVERAGNGARLAQVFVDESEHSKMSPPLYPAALDVLLAWVAGGPRPTGADALAACERARAQFPGECRIRPEFTPGAWTARFTPRQ